MLSKVIKVIKTFTWIFYLNEQRLIYLETYIFEKNDAIAMPYTVIQCQNLPEMSESLGIE